MVNPPIAYELVDHDQYQQHQSYKYQRPFKRSIHLARSSGVVKVVGWEEMESKLLRLNLDVLKLSEQCQTGQDLIGHIGIELPFG
jgi:hypothetical protein